MPFLHSERLRWFFPAALLALAGALPSVPALFFTDASLDARSLEYALAGGAALAALVLALYARSRRGAAASGSVEVAPSGAASDTSFGQSIDPSSLGAQLLVFAPMLPLLAYLLLFSESAYAGLFLSDQDFTNLSSAINNTARSEGFLATPFLATGESASYLGHHFSPTTALYTPFYWLYTLPAEFGFRPQITHALYATLLWATIALGLWLWARLFLEELRDPALALTAAALAALSFPLWRFALSYHYEAPVLPLSALCFLFLKRGRMTPFWICLILWLGVKEDIAVYLALFGLYVFSNRLAAPDDLRSDRIDRTDPGGDALDSTGDADSRATPAHVRRGVAIVAVSVAWFFLARAGMGWFAGNAETIDWSSYWQTDLWDQTKNPLVYGWLLLAFGLLPLLQVRLFCLVILPILGLHFLSGHPWHHAFLGHYSYSVLPFLFLGLAGGLRRVSGWLELFDRRAYRPALLALLIAFGWLAAAADRYTPAPALPVDPRFPTLERMLQELPTDACIQTQAPFSAHAPLRLRVFPLMVPPANPYHQRIPGPHNFEEFHFHEYPDLCARYYLLLDPDEPRPPVYQQEHLDAFRKFAERNLELREAKGGLWLYEFYVRTQ